MDSDYENLREGETDQENPFQLDREPAVMSQRYQEIIGMEDLEECNESQSTWSGDIREGSPNCDQASFLQRNSWSAATLKVLSSMPSRTAGRNGHAVISRRIKRSSQLQQHQTSPYNSPHSFRTMWNGLVLADMVGTSNEESAGSINNQFVPDYWVNENTEELIVSSLKGLSVREAMHKMRTMPLSLADKMKIRRLAFSAEAEQSLNGRNIPCYTHLSAYISRSWRHCQFDCLPLLSSFKLWHSSLKKLSARYGTGVLSYFLFIRTLLFLNLLLFAIVGLFLVFPQAIYPPRDHVSHLSTFKGLELLTGRGYFSQSLMFYGYYSTAIIKMCGVGGCTGDQTVYSTGTSQIISYSIPLAYFFTITIAFFIICIILVYSMSKSFGRSFHVLKSNGNLAVKVFCCWDFKVSKKTSVRLQSEKISTQLKEQLSEMTSGEDEKSWKQRLSCFLVHVVAWTTCLVSICMSALGIHYLSEATIQQHQSIKDDFELLFLSALVSGINLLLPGLFNFCVWVENYESPGAQVYVSIFRNLLLKVSMIGVLCYHWLGRISVKGVDSKCWENFVGQELYRLLVMDFIVTVLYIALGEFLWRQVCILSAIYLTTSPFSRVFSKKILRRRRKPAFDIACNVLELIYGQTLTWLGVLFAPLLPAVQIIKLLLLFYMKQNSLMVNCQAPRKPWRAIQMTTLFVTLLFFPSFLGAAASVIYTVWTIKPSTECGPFRNHTTMFESQWQWAKEVKNAHPILSFLSWVYDSVVDNPVFLFLPSGVLLMVIYFKIQVVDGQRRIISRLEKQIENEGNDKKFLVTKLQEL
ncbi:transmembrane channel-like protein 6 [Pholidichthys leucotaenia]